MKTRINVVVKLAALLAGLASFASVTSAHATPGIAVDSVALPPQARLELRSSIDRARAADPATFRNVRDVVAGARLANQSARGRKATVAHRLASLGSPALLPMLELVAFDAPPLLPGESAADRASAARNLIEAIGLLRDVKAMPVLVTVLARDADFETTRTTAEALARLETNGAASALVAALTKADQVPGDRATAILAGMGACHRAIIASTLATRLGAHPDDAAALRIVRSLDHVGSAWAWRSLTDRTDHTEELAVRETAATALVAAYVQYGGDVREAAAKALLVVDDSHTNALASAARRGASPDVALALDDLARRLAQNPTH